MTMLEIKEIISAKKKYLDLLLIGDEQEDMIDRYIDRGRLFVGFLSTCAVACCVITEDAPGVVEIKNLAVRPDFHRRGIGGLMLKHVEALYEGHIVMLGTGETPSTLTFYRRCGYSYSHRVAGFFTSNYDHVIVEEGVTLVDMIYLKKQL